MEDQDQAELVVAPIINGAHYLWVCALKSPLNGHEGVVVILVTPREEVAHDFARDAIRSDMTRAGEYSEDQISSAEKALASVDGQFVATVDIAAYRP